MKNLLLQKPSVCLDERMKYTLKFFNRINTNNKKILNIGSGYGWFEYRIIKKQFRKLVGLDIDPQNIHLLKRTFNNSKISFIEGSALKLPFNDNEFDIVTSWEVLEHIPPHSELTMFSEVNRVLKRGGYFLLSTPFNQLLTCILDPAWLFIGHRHYSVNKINQIAASTFFNTELITTKGGIWSSINILNMYISKWIFKRQPFFKSFFKRKERYEFNNKQTFNVFAILKKK